MRASSIHRLNSIIMTDKEIDYRKDILHDVGRNRAIEQKSDKYWIYTEREERELEELSCRSMMSSIFAYNGIDTLLNEQSFFFQKYLAEYIKTLGRKRFNEIRDEQVQSYSKCTVSVGVYQDHEGCTYNSINWN